MKNKVALLMDETGCERGEAELALELCGYDLQNAVQVIPRLFQNILVLKGRICVRSECLYGIWLVILNLKDRSLLRARAVLSYNPAVFSSELDQHWFDFEARLYACRLWTGTIQAFSQEVEGILSSYFSSPRAERFYEEGSRIADPDFNPLRAVLTQRLGNVELQVQPEVLDMGQFQQMQPLAAQPGPAPRRCAKRSSRSNVGPGQGPGGLLILRISLEPDAEGIAANDLHAGDIVSAFIEDQRDIAQYLARLLGAKTDQGYRALKVPVEAVEKQPASRGRIGPARSKIAPGEMLVRVRFSAGVCGDARMLADIRLKVVRRNSRMPWWKKIFRGT